ncbi:MAG: hypothetical protein MK097_03840 [Dechloromonas sp.]|nr:hypothetical protein [Dechloromonas sp.]
MANQVLKFADRVAESTITTGTGDIFLAGAIDTTHQSFASAFSDGDLIPVTVFGNGAWMTFIGTYNAGANSLTRTTFKSSSTGSNISLTGTNTVICGWNASTLYDLQTPFPLTDAATIAVDMAKGINYSVTLGGNRTVGAPTNCKRGQSGVFEITQDATGSRTLTWNAAYDFGGAGTPTLSTGTGKTDLISYYVLDASTPLLRCAMVNQAA